MLQVRELSKRFPGVQALDRVELRLGRGEVLAVVGENGAGKSTLMKILAGVQAPDAGEILLEGRPVRIDSVRAAERMGIALIHQELNLCENLSIGANLFLGREPRRFGLIDRAAIAAGAREALGRIGLEAPPETLVETLSIARRQMVEIARALRAEARILIMDEPTSSLTVGEAERLFALIDGLRARGVSVIYISHRLAEVRRVADRVTVLRDGRNAGELARHEIDAGRMVRLMVGRDLSQVYEKHPAAPGAPALEVEGLRTAAHPEHALGFTVRAGEIVGVAGLVGAGRTELLEAIFGIVPPAAGTIRVGGAPLARPTPRRAIRAGLALAPEDRKLHGLILQMALRQNVSLPGLFRHRRGGAFLDGAHETAVAREAIERLSIRTAGDRAAVELLSGGNQQKVVLGKWLALKPRVLLLDEPTRGIDVGAKQEIYRLIDRLAAEGVAILFVSSEMEEILGLSDRVLVMHQGRLSGELARAELAEEAILRLATGAAA